jgi:acyl-CoA reductase-like NAD-dependent aldehyde dehydrogenase
MITSHSPQAPARVLGTWPDAGLPGIEQAVTRARLSWTDWRTATGHERARTLNDAARRVEDCADELSEVVVAEVGKPVGEARGEVQRVSETLRYYAQVALDVEGELYPASRPGTLVFTKRRPRGVAVLITPWNFPLALPVWKMAPALAFGNAVIWKPSPYALASAQALEQALGLHGLVQRLVVGSSTEAFLPAQDGVDVVSFTGSTPAGRAVVSAATGIGAVAQAEMGGHNAAVVLPDADLEHAARCVALAAMAFGGQKCTATKRVIVVGDSSRFREALIEAVRALPIGDPSDERTVVGPVISRRARECVLAAAEEAKAGGGTILLGGEAAKGDGWFVKPTVIADLDRGARFLSEETFGPICAVIEAADEHEAVELVNATRYGMVAAVYSRDIDRVMTVASALDVGIVRVNDTTTGIDFNVPFSGVKDSGFGLGEQARAARDLFTVSTTFAISRAGGERNGASDARSLDA